MSKLQNAIVNYDFQKLFRDWKSNEYSNHSESDLACKVGFDEDAIFEDFKFDLIDNGDFKEADHIDTESEIFKKKWKKYYGERLEEKLKEYFEELVEDFLERFAEVATIEGSNIIGYRCITVEDVDDFVFSYREWNPSRRL